MAAGRHRLLSPPACILSYSPAEKWPEQWAQAFCSSAPPDFIAKVWLPCSRPAEPSFSSLPAARTLPTPAAHSS